MKTAREILLKHAWASVDKHDYLPTTDKEASEFIPHNWATKAVEEALEISQKESAQKLHSEIHKLSNIMEREFGDRVGRYFQSTGEDRQEYAADAAYAADVEHWVNKFFERSGEDKQTYIDEVERLKGDNNMHYDEQREEAMQQQVGGTHYKDLGVQPLELTLKNMGFLAFEGACYTKINKYMIRNKDNKVEQLKKAHHVLSMWIEEAEKQQ